MSEIVTLTTGGRIYQGWTSISIIRGIEAISGRFSIGLTERWPGQDKEWPLLPGAECSVKIGDDTVITGHVDGASTNFDAHGHDSQVRGRDRTGQMVDCSAVHSPDDWKNIRLDKLARILAEPFGISVKSEVSSDRTFDFKLHPGETAFEALDRTCRHCGVLPISDGQGGLVLTKPGQTRCSTALVQGGTVGNVKSASLSNSMIDRYRTYIVRGSQPSTDHVNPEHAAAVEGRASDAGAPANRTLITIAETSVDIDRARRRAEWQATVMAAKAVSAQVTVQGWRQGNGELWPVNALVKVDLPWLRLSGEMLITELTHTLNESGTQTHLTLRRKDAFIPKPIMSKGLDPWGDVG